jgi:hypothetical protein
VVGALAAGLRMPANLPGLRMKVLARAVMAAAVAFAMSAAIAYAAPTELPSKVTMLQAAAGDQEVTIKWSAPVTGNPILSYTVTGSPGGYASTNFLKNRTVSGLTNGTLYTFKVYPRNSVGRGPTSTITVTPHATPPGAPTNLGATQGPGVGQITLSWTPPASTGSAPTGSPTPTIDHYSVTVSPGGVNAQTDASTTTYVASNLAANVTYTFTVTATNSRSVTGAAAKIFAPLPTGATIGLQPSAGVASTNITVTGQLFLKNESITLYWDVSSHVAASVVTDDNGAFTRVVKPFAGDKPAVHKLCASVPPKPCANFTLRPTPTPSPSSPPSPSPEDSPSPAPSEIPLASGTRPEGGLSGLDIITRPPFVFLPIIGILGLLGLIAYLALAGRRRPPPPTPAATVTHLATRPDYMAPFPPAVGPPAAPPAAPLPPPLEPPAQSPLPAAGPPPVVPPQPMPPAAPPAPVEWPDPPGTPDAPPDLPEPSE